MSAQALKLVDRHPYVLPRRVEPFPDESLPGLIMRNAELYHFGDPLRLFSRIRTQDTRTLWAVCQDDPQSLLGIAMGNLLGLSPETWRRMSLWTGEDTTVSVLGHKVWRELVRNSERAVCPDCLRESAYHRAVWMVEALPVCAVHGTWLVTRCPAPHCTRPLGWEGLGAHRCGFLSCAYDLRRAISRPVDPETLGGVRALHGLLHKVDGQIAPLGMPPGEALMMVFRLGQVSFGHVQQARANGYMERHLTELPLVMDAGWRALDDWPNGFHALLTRLHERAAARGDKANLQATFGKLSKRVYDWAREPWGAPIGLAFAEFVTAQSGLAVSTYMLRRYAPGTEMRHVHVSLGEAAKFLDVGPGTVLASAERRNMFARRPEGSGVPALLRADSVRELGEELADFVSAAKARTMLGVGYCLMEQLEGAGLVRIVPEADRIMFMLPYRQGELETFIASCGHDAATMSRDAAKSAGLTPITRVAAPGRSAVDVCRAAIEGRLTVAGIVTGERGLRALRFRMEDVERAAPASRQTMSMVEAGDKLSVHYRHLHLWARKGLLETTTSERAGERGLRVSGEALAYFQAMYIVAAELKTLFEQPDNYWLSRHLLFQGIRPVSGPGVDEGELLLFKRSDLTPDVVQAVRRIQARPPGSGQDKHRAAFVKALLAANAVAARWGAQFERVNNCFTDTVSGRTLQVVSGRRPDLTGVFRFALQLSSLKRLQDRAESWLALVPAQGDMFVLAPVKSVQWRADGDVKAYTTLKFDVAGWPLDAPAKAETVRLS